MRWIVIVLVLIVMASASAAPVQDLQRGYNPRACGFDMDDDGIWGEPEDCNVCDGVTTDPDGDGNAEDQIYVDCDAGVNGDGTPGNPYNSFSNALAAVDGTGDGAEDIICLAGTCNEQIRISSELNGLPVTKTKPATGSEEWDFEYPSQPGMIVGWDRDNDGEYPPFDTDDIAVLDGNRTNKYKHGFRVSETAPTDYVELAHLTFKDFCTHRPLVDPNEACGFFYQNQATPSSDYLYMHDVWLQNMNKGHQMGSNVHWLYNLWNKKRTYHALENIKCTDCAGYGLRGSTAHVSEHLRLKNIEANWHGCGLQGSSNECPGLNSQGSGHMSSIIKIWGMYQYVEFLDSIFDSDSEKWNSGQGAGMVVNTCVLDFVGRNNEIIAFQNGLNIQGGNKAGCETRKADKIIFDRNLIWQDTDYWKRSIWGSTTGFNIEAGRNSVLTWTENVNITNNIVVSDIVSSFCFTYSAGPPTGASTPTGTIVFTGNTCIVNPIPNFPSRAFFGVSDNTPFAHENYVVKNNLFIRKNQSVPKLMVFLYIPQNLDVDNNVFDSEIAPKSYRLGGTWYDSLDQFVAASGTNQNSRGGGQNPCTPSIVSYTDPHLQPGDTCAKDAGAALPGLTTDYDGDTRPQGAGWDAGADEITGGPACNWADVDCNGDISISELVTVVLDWQAGSRSISELVQTVLLWQS